MAVFLCALFLLTTAHASALSSKQLALTEDPFHYKETALKQAEEAKEKEEAQKKKEAEQKQAEEQKKKEDAQPAVKPVVNHTVAPGESLIKIASVYNTTWDRLYAKNTQIAQPDVINVNDIIVIPEADEVLPERAVPIAAPVAVSTGTGRVAKTSAARTQVRGSSAGNTYTAGYCTWYAKNRRPDLPNRLGNASAWVSSAAAQGFATGSAPRAGAIGQQGNHVVYVESVNGDGTVTVSEMNYHGLFVISSRTVAASNFRYIY